MAIDAGKFIDEYLEANDKSKYVKKHIITDYIDYETKVAQANDIVIKSVTEIDGDNVKFKMNTTTRYVLWCIAVYKLYTDITFDQINIMLQFNLLEKHEVMKVIYEFIGKDVERFKTTVEMCLNDYLTNNRSSIAFFENKINDFIQLTKNIDLQGVNGE